MRRNIFDEIHDDFRATAREFFERECVPNTEKWERDGKVSREAWLAAGEHGLIGWALPLSDTGREEDARQPYGGGVKQTVFRSVRFLGDATVHYTSEFISEPLLLAHFGVPLAGGVLVAHGYQAQGVVAAETIAGAETMPLVPAATSASTTVPSAPWIDTPRQ